MNIEQQKVRFLLAVVAIMLAFGSITMIANAEGEESAKKESLCDQMKQVYHDHEAISVHMDYYYQLLAQKHAPNTEKTWQEIRKERDLIDKKLKEATQQGKLLHAETIDKEWLDKHGELQKEFTKAIKKQDGEKIKEILPQLFEQHKELNNILKSRLDMVK
ncbi:hypothetical protein ACJ2A9_04670 [Anaerobacillus sp. MEB173]|uniref:hypothetical protein n=1 Tax=Anaerobacillus sp. MEB173 TaxID=3383345 RepID=UPI003F9337BE